MARRAPAAPAAGDELAASTVEIVGVVQSVGFRPFVWRLADRLGVAGSVRNRSGVVEIHAEGPTDVLDRFCAALAEEAPLARVKDVRWAPARPDGLRGFEVDVSLDGEGGERPVSPDVATCPACPAMLFDPADRRYRYTFISCTDCGPRFAVNVVLRQIGSGLASPWTSSAGRLFDAVRALAGVCRLATYEGQPAMLLEQAADAPPTLRVPLRPGAGGGAARDRHPADRHGGGPRPRQGTDGRRGLGAVPPDPGLHPGDVPRHPGRDRPDPGLPGRGSLPERPAHLRRGLPTHLLRLRGVRAPGGPGGERRDQPGAGAGGPREEGG